MRKEKLRAKRIERNLSQQQIAKMLHMEQSTYSRRERGDTKISLKEWEKISEVLKCELSEIFEPDLTSDINFDNKNAIFPNNYANNNNSYYNFIISVLENLQDFIEHLKEENQRLKQENDDLHNKKSN